MTPAQCARRTVANLIREHPRQVVSGLERFALAPGADERAFDDFRRERGGITELRLRARERRRIVGVERALQRGFVEKNALGGSERTGRSGASLRHAASESSVCGYI